ncbi:Membrane protein palmitoylated 2a (MAGUK p55 subfamily member 2) [Fasciola hepatica]|uniref:Membrane protein palmitoylated 2a (MAGUK p55 subfamily member 2) n=1 Tax=Fasciola hepatica TaxID=6192 RepID=A0A4E0R7X2_FASHE|nr:Membrane protein palmitoylated 2a (MAGUK p55 subfamily member 2) [Fasciola hepatica]
MHFLAALKKAKKNVRKIFDSPEAKLIHSYLSSPVVKEITQVFDILSLSHHTPVKEDEDLSSTVQGTVEALHAGPLSVDQNDIEANELIQLLRSIHFNAFAETYTEIATRNFHMPELPDSAFYAASGLGTYGTMGSLAASRGQIAPSIRLSSGDLLNGASDPSLLNAYSTSRPNLPPPGSAPGYIDLRKTEATLTGGGVGPALPPVEGTMKIISFEKNLGEDLGITIVQQPYVSAHYGLVKELVVKRILTASRIEQQGLLHEGDVIREANGVPVDNPQVLQRLLRNATGTVTLKIIPGYQSTPLTSQLFLRAYFTYNPKNDNLIPCKEAGLPFEAGSVLQVLKQEDPHWWQARHYGHQQRAGLIPSVVLQERRRAFVQSAPHPDELTYKLVACGLARRRRKKIVVPFRARDAEEYENKDLVLYEEVALISGFQRPVICLIGASGVGRRSLRRMLVRSNPERYGLPVLHTTKEPDADDEEDDTEFVLDTHVNMESDDLHNKYLEFGEYEGHYYGTKLDSIRQVVATGRTCLLTCNVQVVPKIRNSEFMPFVVFLAAPSVSCMKAMYEYGMSMRFTDKWKRDENFRHTLEASKHIEQNYRHLLDMIMLCDNIEANFERLSQALNDLLTQPQWVPARWLY